MKIVHSEKKMEQHTKVWDVQIRLFHWLLAIGFACAYFSARYHLKDLHVMLGYGLSVLLAGRILWGFAGSRYARFNSFFFSPRETIAYLRSMIGSHPKYYFGHNPAGALMVFALLALLILILASGVLTLGVIDFEGPLRMLFSHLSDETSYAVRHLHNFLTNVIIMLIILHIIGVIAGSLQHGENLILAMITGKKRDPSC